MTLHLLEDLKHGSTCYERRILKRIEMVRTQENDLKLAEGGCNNLSIQIGVTGVTSEGAW